MKKLLFLGVFIGVLCVSTVSAMATMSLSLTDGTTTVNVTDNGAGDIDYLTYGGSVDGLIVWSGAIGVWSINVSTGISKPEQGSTTEPSVHLNSVDRSTQAGMLTIMLTDTGFGPTPEGSLLSEFGGLPDTQVGSFDIWQALDTRNGPFVIEGPEGVVYTITASDVVSDIQSISLPALSGPYSITEKVVITHTGAGTSSFDLESTVVPVPGALLLGLIGLGATGLKLRKYA